MPYVAPSTVTTLQTYTSAAHNVIVNDIIDHETRLANLAPLTAAWTAWTPTITQGATMSISTNTSAYLKIGSLAIVRCNVTFTSAGTLANTILVNVPAALATSSNFNYLSVGVGSLFITPTDRYHFVLTTNNSTTQFRLAPTTSNTDFVLGSGVFSGALKNGDALDFTAAWQVAP